MWSAASQLTVIRYKSLYKAVVKHAMRVQSGILDVFPHREYKVECGHYNTFACVMETKNRKLDSHFSSNEWYFDYKIYLKRYIEQKVPVKHLKKLKSMHQEQQIP